VGGGAQNVDALRYRHAEPAPAEHLDELALVRLRHKPPHGGASRLIERPVPVADSGRSLEESSDDFRFAAAVAGFGALLRGGTVVDGFSYADVLQLARSARGTDDSGYRGEFLSLVRTAEALQPGPVGTPLVGQH
jgi:Ca-activated chloride channel family protein